MSANPDKLYQRFTRFLQEDHASGPAFLSSLRIHLNLAATLDELRIRIHPLLQQKDLPVRESEWLGVVENRAVVLLPTAINFQDMDSDAGLAAIQELIQLARLSGLHFVEVIINAFKRCVADMPSEGIRHTRVSEIMGELGGIHHAKAAAHLAQEDLIAAANTVDVLPRKLPDAAKRASGSPTKDGKEAVKKYVIAAVNELSLSDMARLFQDLATIVQLTNRPETGRELIDYSRLLKTGKTATREQIEQAVDCCLFSCFCQHKIVSQGYVQQNALTMLGLLKVPKHQCLVLPAVRVLRERAEFERLRTLDSIWGQLTDIEAQAAAAGGLDAKTR